MSQSVAVFQAVFDPHSNSALPSSILREKYGSHTAVPMGYVLRLLRSNAHVLNYTVMAVVLVCPVVAFAQLRSPSPQEVESALVSTVRGRAISRYMYQL